MATYRWIHYFDVWSHEEIDDVTGETHVNHEVNNLDRTDILLTDATIEELEGDYEHCFGDLLTDFLVWQEFFLPLPDIQDQVEWDISGEDMWECYATTGAPIGRFELDPYADQ